METFYVTRISEVNRNKDLLEEKLKVKLTISGIKVEVEGKAVDEFEATRVFDAVVFGFSVKKALLVLNEDFVFKTVHIKDHTKRNLKDVQARIIGTKGKARRTISDISGCELLIKEGEVGIIGDVESAADAETAVVNIIKGSKQSNMYRYLEKRNAIKKNSFDPI